MRTVKTGVFLLSVWCIVGGCKDKLFVNVCKLSYDKGDLLFISTSPQTAAPIVNPGAKGVFAADPDGLVIDANTGVIDINNSTTGQQYLVKYISLDNNQICETFVTISGIRYRPDIYNRSTANPLILNPVYNANTDNRLPSGNFQGGINPQEVLVLPEVTPADGSIDLKAVNLNRLFSRTGGGVIPDGTSVVVTIPYFLNDDSGGTRNEFQLTFIYYNQEASIPESLRAQIREQQSEYRGGRVNGEMKHQPPQVVVTEK